MRSVADLHTLIVDFICVSTPDQLKELHLEASLPIINARGTWIHAQVKQVLPQKPD